MQKHLQRCGHGDHFWGERNERSVWLFFLRPKMDKNKIGERRYNKVVIKTLLRKGHGAFALF